MSQFNRSADAVVVTGLGMVTPLGADVPSTWENLLAGKAAGEWLTHERWNRSFPPPDSPWAGCPAIWPKSPDWLIASPSKLVALSRIAAAEAVRDAGGMIHCAPERRGVVIGTSKLDFQPLDDDLVSGGGFLLNEPARQIAIEYNCRVAALCPVAACATGVASILRGVELIQHDLADVVLAGGVDASLHPALLAAYARLGVMTRPLDVPHRAVQPFDVNRRGFLVGEGGAVLVLERAGTAASRRAKIYGTVVGGGLSCDPTGLTLVDESGARLGKFVEKLLQRLAIAPAEIDAVNLHGTATKLNDFAESRGLVRALGAHAQNLPACATKGATGHLMGAAGAVESAIALLSLRFGQLPPNVNLRNQEPDCPFRFSKALESRDLRTMLKLSLGFGGHLAALVFRS